MSGVPAYPQPTLTVTNKPLIEAWQRGELVLQHCGACSTVVFFPRDVCPACWSCELKWQKHSGRGRVVSYSQVYSHVTEPFVAESPITLAEIALEDGGAMLARVVDSVILANARIQVEQTTSKWMPAYASMTGIAVELVPMPDAARYSLPTFRVAARR